MNLSRQDAVATLSGQTLAIERLSLPGRLSFDLTPGCMRRTRAAILAWLPVSCRYVWVPRDVYVKVLPYMPPGIRINRCKAMEDPKTHLNSVLNHRRDDCSVCLTSLAIGNITAFSCGHAYHHDCIHRWVCVEKKKSCPYCRAYISRRMCCKCHPPKEWTMVNEAGQSVTVDSPVKLVRLLYLWDARRIVVADKRARRCVMHWNRRYRRILPISNLPDDSTAGRAREALRGIQRVQFCEAEIHKRNYR